MTAILPAGSRLLAGVCSGRGMEQDVLVAPDRLVLEVFPGESYVCLYGSNAPGEPQPPLEEPAPTAPPTDTLAIAQTGSSNEWPLVLAVMAAVIAASLLIAARYRLRS